MSETLNVIRHPLVQHKLTQLRDKTTATSDFRRILSEVSLLLGYEVMRDLPLTTVEIETPVAPMAAPVLAGKKLVLVSILRAGDGLLDGLLDLVPLARVGHIGLYRDPETLKPVAYYKKLPDDIALRPVIVVDPMLATANSAVEAVTQVKAAGASNIKFVCVLAAPEGVATFTAAHADVPIFTAAVDEKLNEKSYITPGLGDAGDRMYGTK